MDSDPGRWASSGTEGACETKAGRVIQCDDGGAWVMAPLDGPSREIESKPTIAGKARPLSWGERVEQRHQRERAGKFAWLNNKVIAVFAKLGRFSRSVGVTRRRIEIQGVVYRELNNTSLRRALSVTGSGLKEYHVRFPVLGSSMASPQYPMRESMDIRYTRTRMFGDLGHEPRVGFLEQVKKHIKPGDRVLELGCGTGSASGQLAELVGPSGGVVAINRDGESIRYARQRHRHNHLAFELGWLETLEGELDGAFSCVIVVDLFRDAPDAPSKSRAIADIWRLVQESGMVALVCSDRNQLSEMSDRLEALGVESLKVLDVDPVLGWGGLVGFQPPSKRS
ncbi:MAG: methyltransferase domain-containing protein [Phycisphaerales bacterium]|nr:methyltransferase domain-containing protein [Phycisphaerales bacterium]